MVATPLLLLAAILQSTVINAFVGLTARPILVLVMVIAWSMVPGRGVQGPVWGLVGGLALDLFSGGPFGAQAIALLAASIPIALIESRLWRGNALFVVGAAGLGSVIFYLIYLLLIMFTGISVDWSAAINNVVLPSTGANMLLSMPAYWLARWINAQLYPPDLEV